MTTKTFKALGTGLRTLLRRGAEESFDAYTDRSLVKSLLDEIRFHYPEATGEWIGLQNDIAMSKSLRESRERAEKAEKEHRKLAEGRFCHECHHPAQEHGAHNSRIVGCQHVEKDEAGITICGCRLLIGEIVWEKKP